MRYITKEIWLDWNSNDEEIRQKAFEESNQRFKDYSEKLETIRSQIGDENYEFFKNGLHDGRIISFNVGEGIDLDYEKKSTFSLEEFAETKVRIEVLEGYFEDIFTLKYEKVRKILFDFPTNEPLWGNTIGDWGYDEIHQIDDDYYSHETLFRSGTIVLIEFQKFSFSKRQCERSCHPKRP
jgi:hypothetical protein